MRPLEESVSLAISLLVILPLGVGLTCGFLSAWLARRKHRSRTRWFLIGFLFPVVGLITALFIPAAREPYALKIKRLRRAIDADIKSGGKGFRQRAANLWERVRNMDEAANRIDRRLLEAEKHLRNSDPQRLARRRRQLARSLEWARDSAQADEIRGEMEALEEELRTHRQLEEKADKLRLQLMNTVTVAEKLGHRIRRLSFGAEDQAPTEEELQEIIQELDVEVEALEELHQRTE